MIPEGYGWKGRMVSGEWRIVEDAMGFLNFPIRYSLLAIRALRSTKSLPC
jgi:hypothetical protein